jgi:3-phenylpropionate/trans-cinnamate dioxygenase ferredoxin reductase subunit
VTDDRVLAAGDAASWWSRRYGVRMAVEHWDDALKAPEVVAANVVGGDAVHDPVPYFWSTQFGRRVQMVGYPRVADQLLWRGDPAEDAWCAGWLRDGLLTAMVTVNRPRDTIQARKLIEAGGAVDADALSDLSVAVRDAAT